MTAHKHLTNPSLAAHKYLTNRSLTAHCELFVVLSKTRTRLFATLYKNRPQQVPQKVSATIFAFLFGGQHQHRLLFN